MADQTIVPLGNNFDQACRRMLTKVAVALGRCLEESLNFGLLRTTMGLLISDARSGDGDIYQFSINPESGHVSLSVEKAETRSITKLDVTVLLKANHIQEIR